MKMQKYDSELSGLKKKISSGRYTISDIDPKVFANPAWDQMTRAQVEELLLPAIRYQLDRALRTMPLVYEAYRKVKPEKIESMEDFYRLPLLMKDPAAGSGGLREKFRKHGPSILCPTDLNAEEKTVMNYFSGGTKGLRTPTMVTEQDLEIEAYASKRGLLAAGIKPGSTIIDTYNSSHKGGEVIKRAFWKLPSKYVQAKSDDKAAALLDMIERFKEPGRELVFDGVQTAGLKGLDEQQKGSGRQFFDLLYGTDARPEVIEKIDRIAIGGFRIIDELREYALAFNKPVTSLFGATEAMPAFYGTWDDLEHPLGKKCTFNNLHVMFGPHYIELVKFEKDRWVPCQPGERGVLAFTTVFREGTIYMRYLLGDEATLLHPEGSCVPGCSKTEIVTGIKRIDKGGLEDIVNTGCAAL